MTTAHALAAAVETAFTATARGLAAWADPHPDRSPGDEEYARVTDPDKWRLVGARADAWLVALAATGLAEVEPGAGVRWRLPPPTIVTRADRAVPRAGGAQALIVARSRLGDVDDAGVTLGFGDPAVRLAVIPDCGCDACDSGSRDVLDELDEHVWAVVSGRCRRLWRGDRDITALGAARWSASGRFRRGEVAEILARPDGWHQLRGSSWILSGRAGTFPDRRGPHGVAGLDG